MMRIMKKEKKKVGSSITKRKEKGNGMIYHAW